MEYARRFTLLAASGRFVVRYPQVFVSFGLAAATARAVQVGVLGTVPTPLNVGLEIMVAAARCLLFLAALGGGQIRRGWVEVRRWFRRDAENSKPTMAAVAWPTVVWSFAGFLALALLLNGTIYLLIHQTPLLLWLNDLQPRLSFDDVAVTLILKNLTSIAFTIVFLGTTVRAWVTPAAGAE